MNTPRALSFRARLRPWIDVLSQHPVVVVFVCSLLMSYAVIHGNTLNRDGMLYVDSALTWFREGLSEVGSVIPRYALTDFCGASPNRVGNIA
jgi:hypothetical protein